MSPSGTGRGADASRERGDTASRRAASRIRWPWLSLALVLAALGASSAPGSSEALAFRRTAFEAGEAWRVLTMHLVHPWPRLALFDLGALCLFGGALERRSRSLLAASIAAAGLLAAAVVVGLRTDLETYRGASALVAGIWTALAIDCIGRGDRATRAAGALLLLAWVGKTAGESTGLWPTAWDVLPPGVERVAEAHAAGGFGGALAAIAARHATRWSAGTLAQTPTRCPAGRSSGMS